MDFLMILSDKMRKTESTTTPEANEDIFQELTRPTYELHWRALDSLLSRPWWTRVWTVQEFVLSSKVTLACGSRSLTRSNFGDAMQMVWHCAFPESGSEPSSISRVAFYHAWNRRRLLEWFTYGQVDNDYRPSLVAILSVFSDHQATNDRDRIYSFLGLSANPGLIKVDYTETIDTVYSNFIISFIQEHRNLDIICFAHNFRFNEPQEPAIPSRVSDWRVNLEPNVVPLMVSQSGNKSIGNLRRPSLSCGSVIYSACGTRGPEVKFPAAGRIECKGILLDSIDGLGGNAIGHWFSDGNQSDGMVQSTSARNTRTGHEHMPSNSKTDATVSYSTMLKICRSLVLGRQDRYLRHPPRIDRLITEFHMFCQKAMSSPSEVHATFRDWYSCNRSLKVQGIDLELFSRQTLGYIEYRKVDFYDHSDWNCFLARFRDTTVKMARRLMATNRGLIGMAPHRAQKGDIVCILFGCSVPVVLRGRSGEEEYEFIGECYVDGFMNGEALAHSHDEESGPVERLFCIS